MNYAPPPPPKPETAPQPLAYWRLDFTDRDFKLIFPCQIPLTRHGIVRAYHLELLKAVQNLTVWPPPDDFDEDSWDLYPDFSLYYQKVMSLVDTSINCDRLLPSSRHLFLVCTEPLPYGEQMIPGLSGLEQLMGFTLPKHGEKPQPKDDSIPTTGDSVLDVKVDTFLVFKNRATRLIEEHSLDELCRMAKQAGDRMAQAKGEDSDEKQVKEAEDDEWFTSKKAMFLNRLKAMKIDVPSNF